MTFLCRRRTSSRLRLNGTANPRPRGGETNNTKGLLADCVSFLLLLLLVAVRERDWKRGGGETPAPFLASLAPRSSITVEHGAALDLWQASFLFLLLFFYAAAAAVRRAEIPHRSREEKNSTIAADWFPALSRALFFPSKKLFFDPVHPKTTTDKKRGKTK